MSKETELNDLRHLEGKEFQLALDAGCGTGRNADELAAVAEKVVALDIDLETIQEFVSKRRPPNSHELLVGSATEIPCPDNKFDLVVSYTVYEHIPEEQIDRYLSELYRYSQMGERHI